MGAKVILKSNNIQSFGGIFYVMQELKKLGFDQIIDNHLGIRNKYYGY